MEYTADDVLRVARRHNNEKRSYLLVNPLQGKHMPVSPSLALDMMQALGAKVAKAVPHARLVIGFAETATAIGAVVAKSLADSCLYVQTTRETLPVAAHAIEFMESTAMHPSSGSPRRRSKRISPRRRRSSSSTTSFRRAGRSSTSSIS